MNGIKLRDARRILKANGYELAYVNGNHHMYCKGSHKIAIPFHVNRSNECSGKLWKAICKQNNIQY